MKLTCIISFQNLESSVTSPKQIDFSVPNIIYAVQRYYAGDFIILYSFVLNRWEQKMKDDFLRHPSKLALPIQKKGLHLDNI